MPSRPQQSSPAQMARWEARRSATGARIRELRLAQNLSQEALALESGLSRNMIIGIEWGRRASPTSACGMWLMRLASPLVSSLRNLLHYRSEFRTGADGGRWGPRARAQPFS
jgi:transcriptional regulator with XRE-family HTH domain